MSRLPLENQRLKHMPFMLMGRDAFLAGLGPEANPYKGYRDIRRHAWSLGFHETKHEQQKGQVFFIRSPFPNSASSPKIESHQNDSESKNNLNLMEGR